MPTLRPFPGIRYQASSELEALTCPPYDVMSTEDQERFYSLHPHNAVRLELPKGSDHAAAGANFQRWTDDDVLVPDDIPCLYAYRQDFIGPDGRRRRVAGVIGALELEPFGKDAGVLPHERTMPGPKKDRLALMRACPVNISPIFAIYRGASGLAPFFDSLQDRPTDARFVDDSGTLHRLWVLRSAAEIDTVAAAVGGNTLVIADGHHRYETALAYHEEQSGHGDHDSIMCFCVDADVEELVVLPYHRVLVSPVPPEEIERQLTSSFAVSTVDDVQALEDSKADHAFLFVLPGGDLLVEVGDEAVVAAVGDRAPEWRRLDVVALHEAVLPQVAGPDVELAFSRDEVAIRDAVAGDATAGVLMRAIRPAEVVDVARSGERMPQKASYFWPKAVTGLVFHSLR